MVKELSQVPCRYCKEPINLSDKQCPHCGTISPNLKLKTIFGITFVVLGVFFLYWLLTK